MKRLLLCLVTWITVLGGVAQAQAPLTNKDEAARNHYETGLALFDAGDREQALEEFRLAHELFPSNDVVFMLAQCEYHLGRLKDARAHYETFVQHEPTGPLSETARLRIAAIDRRPSVFVINTVPSDVQVVIEGNGRKITGQAPNEFSVPRGSYTITVSRKDFQTQVRQVQVGIAETQPLFFKLDPVPGRLLITTTPPHATLFVRGMRAENPYNQRLEPGVYEVYAEADNHESRRETVEVEPGQDQRVRFELNYVQRSGRSELIAFWGLVGAAAAVGLVADIVDPNVGSIGTTPNPAPLSLLVAAAGVGAVSGGFLGARLTPHYIPDNKAMFRIGAMATGGLAGALVGTAIRPNLTYGLTGGLAGLGLGAAAGQWLDHRAPSYGRVTLIQSGVVMGSLAGLLAVPAFGIDREYANLAVLGGMGVGLVAGLAGAYFPDPAKHRLSWRRMVLIDLAVAAGAFAGAVVGTIPNCKPRNCEFEDTPGTTQKTLIGGFVGLGAGWLLTRGLDDPASAPAPNGASGFVPSVSALPTQRPDGRWEVSPGLVARGAF